MKVKLCLTFGSRVCSSRSRSYYKRNVIETLVYQSLPYFIQFVKKNFITKLLFHVPRETITQENRFFILSSFYFLSCRISYIIRQCKQLLTGGGSNLRTHVRISSNPKHTHHDTLFYIHFNFTLTNLHSLPHSSLHHIHLISIISPYS